MNIATHDFFFVEHTYWNVSITSKNCLFLGGLAERYISEYQSSKFFHLPISFSLPLFFQRNTLSSFIFLHLSHLFLTWLPGTHFYKKTRPKKNYPSIRDGILDGMNMTLVHLLKTNKSFLYRASERTEVGSRETSASRARTWKRRFSSFAFLHIGCSVGWSE